MIHYLKGHKGKIYDFAAVEAKRCDKITYHIAKLLKDNELCDDILGPAGPARIRPTQNKIAQQVDELYAPCIFLTSLLK